jgi:hypothetical protein
LSIRDIVKFHQITKFNIKIIRSLLRSGIDKEEIKKNIFIKDKNMPETKDHHQLFVKALINRSFSDKYEYAKKEWIDLGPITNYKVKITIDDQYRVHISVNDDQHDNIIYCSEGNDDYTDQELINKFRLDEFTKNTCICRYYPIKDYRLIENMYSEYRVLIGNVCIKQINGEKDKYTHEIKNIVRMLTRNMKYDIKKKFKRPGKNITQLACKKGVINDAEYEFCMSLGSSYKSKGFLKLPLSKLEYLIEICLKIVRYFNPNKIYNDFIPDQLIEDIVFNNLNDKLIEEYANKYLEVYRPHDKMKSYTFCVNRENRDAKYIQSGKSEFCYLFEGERRKLIRFFNNNKNIKIFEGIDSTVITFLYGESILTEDEYNFIKKIGMFRSEKFASILLNEIEVILEIHLKIVKALDTERDYKNCNIEKILEWIVFNNSNVNLIKEYIERYYNLIYPEHKNKSYALYMDIENDIIQYILNINGRYGKFEFNVRYYKNGFIYPKWNKTHCSNRCVLCSTYFYVVEEERRWKRKCLRCYTKGYSENEKIKGTFVDKEELANFYICNKCGTNFKCFVYEKIPIKNKEHFCDSCGNHNTCENINYRLLY